MTKWHFEVSACGVSAMTEDQFLSNAKSQVLRIFAQVETKWRPFIGYGRRIYSPEIDLAVGPYTIGQSCQEEYDQLLDKSREFVQSLIVMHNQNVEGEEETTEFERLSRFNDNARCFLSMEVERTGSRKHCIGDLVNASALGRIGVIVAREDRTLKTVLRQREYLNYLYVTKYLISGQVERGRSCQVLSLRDTTWKPTQGGRSTGEYSIGFARLTTQSDSPEAKRLCLRFCRTSSKILACYR